MMMNKKMTAKKILVSRTFASLARCSSKKSSQTLLRGRVVEIYLGFFFRLLL
jgi:hypothetical protein